MACNITKSENLRGSEYFPYPLYMRIGAMRILFARKENNKTIYSTIRLLELPSSAILESTSEHNQRNQRWLRNQ